MRELLTRRTLEEKRKAWNKILVTRASYFEELYNGARKEHEKIIIGKLANLETTGGNCPTCNRPWLQKKFDNDFLSGQYYQPDCECFIQCPRCGSWLYETQLKYHYKITHCDNCSWNLFKNGKKQFGKDFIEACERADIKIK